MPRSSSSTLEPVGAELEPAVLEHRRELIEFTDRVTGGHPMFESMSYSDLWASWSEQDDPELARHAHSLKARYEVAASLQERRPDIQRLVQNVDAIAVLLDHVRDAPHLALEPR